MPPAALLLRLLRDLSIRCHQPAITIGQSAMAFVPTLSGVGGRENSLVCERIQGLILGLLQPEMLPRWVPAFTLKFDTRSAYIIICSSSKHA